MHRNRFLMRITHWLPIITFCPVNKLPDAIFITVEFTGFAELYAVRKAIRKTAAWRLDFMEDIAQDVLEKFPEARAVELRLMFNKHHIRIER